MRARARARVCARVHARVSVRACVRTHTFALVTKNRMLSMNTGHREVGTTFERTYCELQYNVHPGLGGGGLGAGSEDITAAGMLLLPLPSDSSVGLNGTARGGRSRACKSTTRSSFGGPRFCRLVSSFSRFFSARSASFSAFSA